MEDWIRIKEFPRYSVSRLGDVRNDLTGRIMRVKVTQGIPFVGLMGEDGLQHQRALARLVAEAFVPKENRWFTTPVNKDGDRFNNRWDNLVWRPRGFSPKYYEQFDRHYEYNYHVNRPMRDDKGQEYPDSWIKW